MNRCLEHLGRGEPRRRGLPHFGRFGDPPHLCIFQGKAVFTPSWEARDVQYLARVNHELLLPLHADSAGHVGYKERSRTLPGHLAANVQPVNQTQLRVGVAQGSDGAGGCGKRVEQAAFLDFDVLHAGHEELRSDALPVGVDDRAAYGANPGGRANQPLRVRITGLRYDDHRLHRAIDQPEADAVPGLVCGP